MGGTTPWSTSCCPLPLSLCPKGDENRYCMCLKYDLYILTIMMILSAYVQIWIQYSQYIANIWAHRSLGPWARKWVPTSVWVWHVFFVAHTKGFTVPWTTDHGYLMASICILLILAVHVQLYRFLWNWGIPNTVNINVISFHLILGTWWIFTCCLEVAQASASLWPPPGMAPALYLRGTVAFYWVIQININY